MSKLTGKQEILIREYEEAGKTCRWYEHLRRLNLFVFVAMVTVIIGFIQTRELSSIGNIPLELFGIFIGVTIWDAEKRVSDYYKFYIWRAKDIERELGMTLYQDGWKNIQETTTFSIRIPFQLIPIFIVGYFSCLIIYQVYHNLQLIIDYLSRYWWLIIILICLGLIIVRERKRIKTKFKRLREGLRQISHIIFT
ncbi:MAG: hypothetical protein HXS54_11825 [Theionarchaea archaeon]|nr:hypothetical protein [Theionarchaea archaeon]